MANGLPPPPVNDKPGSFAWLEWYRQLRNYVSTSGSVPWYIINFAGSNITDIALRDHNQLQNTQGGTSGQKYHLTQAQHSSLTDLATNKAYGEMGFTNGGVTVTVSVVDTWYPIASGFSAGNNLNFTFQNNHELVANVSGKFLLNWAVSAEVGVSNRDTEYGISVNGTAIGKSTSHLHFQNINSELSTGSTAIVQLGAGDIVRLIVRNRTAANNILVDHASITLVRIDN